MSDTCFNGKSNIHGMTRRELVWEMTKYTQNISKAIMLVEEMEYRKIITYDEEETVKQSFKSKEIPEVSQLKHLFSLEELDEAIRVKKEEENNGNPPALPVGVSEAYRELGDKINGR